MASQMSSVPKESVVLIVGASSGIGAAIAKHLSLIGYTKLVLVARREHELNSISLECQKVNNNTEVLQIVRDVTQSHAPKSIVEETVDRFGQLDVLIYAAATLGPIEPIMSISASNVDKVLKTNLIVPLEVTQNAMPFLKKRNGCVLYISSVAARRPAVNFGLYSVSKSALVTMAKSIALENKEVRVNTISPGPVLTEMLVRAAQMEDQEEPLEVLRSSDYAESLPLGGFAETDQVARVAAFIIDKENNAFMTGTDVLCDGGFLLK